MSPLDATDRSICLADEWPTLSEVKGAESLLACHNIANLTNRACQDCQIREGMRIVSRITSFITEVKVELQKVSWSDRNELIGSTGIVIVSTALLAVFIGIVDIILSRFINILLR